MSAVVRNYKQPYLLDYWFVYLFIHAAVYKLAACFTLQCHIVSTVLFFWTPNQYLLISNECAYLNCMVADLYHFLFFLSLFRLSGQRHENSKYARRNNVILTGEGTKISLLKISCRLVEIFRVVALCLSCLCVFAPKRESQNNDNDIVSGFAFR